MNHGHAVADVMVGSDYNPAIAQSYAVVRLKRHYNAVMVAGSDYSVIITQ